MTKWQWFNLEGFNCKLCGSHFEMEQKEELGNKWVCKACFAKHVATCKVCGCGLLFRREVEAGEEHICSQCEERIAREEAEAEEQRWQELEYIYTHLYMFPDLLD